MEEAAVWERRFFRGCGYRAYYTIIRGVVTVEKIEYEGRSE
jgi:putative component of toxin-antitoxin plasmid stabilization module